ncbi:micronuclear linker histone polyprotein-like [Arachis ipaensis]|nr:micronuclear linker histone polyprotein-like [Arachis ipaensis]XP_025679101.1 micronuclear linker histone polyprotein-like [Arachis hypogaea]
MPPPYRKPSHRPIKKRKRGPDEARDSSQSHLSRRGQIQRCSNCGESGHKRRGCKKPSLDDQNLSQSARKRTRGGRKASSSRPTSSSKASSQPVMQSESRGLRRSTRSRSSSQPQPATTTSKPNSTQSGSRPTSSSTRPKTKPTRSNTQQPPPPKEMGAACSSQAARTVSFSHKFPLHVSPRKLRLMAKLPPRLWGKL